MQITRSWLFVPGNQPRMLAKAAALTADVVVYDLEDSVPPAEKETARRLVAEALAEPRGRTLGFVRINRGGPADMAVELEALWCPGLDGLVLPKVEGPDELRGFADLIASRETATSDGPSRLKLVATIETARGLVAAAAIAGSSPRLMALLFGAEDYADDLGALDFRSGTTNEMLYARSAVAAAAAAHGLVAIDRVVTDVHNRDLLVRDADQGRQLGFRGKAVIHPAQIDPVNAAFSPAEKDVLHAQRVVAAFAQAERDGRGSVLVEGEMVDWPVVKKARRILELAAAINLTGKADDH